MIAIDSNVLLRYLLQDDTEQSKKATDLITGKQHVLVTDVVLTETIWTLTGKRYSADKDTVVRVVRGYWTSTILAGSRQLRWPVNLRAVA